MTTYPLWPLDMRQSGAAGVAGGPQNNSVTFTPEIGPPISRRRSSNFFRKYKINFDLLSRTEYDIFQTFFHTTLVDGSLPFAWKHPITGVLHKCRFDLGNDQPYEERRRTNDKYDIDFAMIVLNNISNAASDLLANRAGYAFDWVSDTYAIIRENDEIELGTFSTKIPCTRNSVATYVGSDGLLKTIAANTWRPAYDRLTGERIGIRQEAKASTNLFLNSEDFSNAEYTKNQVTATAAAGTAPDGATTAYKLKPNVNNSQHCLRKNVTLTATRYSISCWMKAAEYTNGYFQCLNAADSSNIYTVIINLSTGAITTISAAGSAASNSVATAEQYANGWWRFSASFVATAETWTISVGPSQSGAVTIADGDGSKGALFWGLQLETAEPSSYIKTTGATATRQAEPMTFNIGSGTDYPSATLNGTVFCDSYLRNILYTAFFPTVVQLDDGASSYLSTFSASAFSNNQLLQIKNGSSVNVNSGVAAPIGTRTKAAFGWTGSNNVAYCVNSGAVITSTSYVLPSVVNRNAMGNANGNNTLRRFMHLVDKLSNSEIQALAAA